MKMLVTGGTGFTGRFLIQRLCESGNHVRALVRDKSKGRALFKGLNIELVEGDITDYESVDNAVKGTEKVFHLAAIYRTAGMPDKVYWDVHVTGTQNLLEACLKNDINRFIHCSTIGVHGHIEDEPANESHPFNPGDIYQLTKLEGERKARQLGRETGLPVAIVRPCAILGPGDMRLYKLFKLASQKITLLFGSGNIMYHMVYIDDLIDSFVLAAEKNNAIGETIIIGGADYVTLNEIVDMIAEILEKPIIKIHLPVKPLHLLGFVCEKLFIPLGIEPPIYRRRVDFFTKSRAFDITKARKILNYEPKVSIKDGLAKTAAWYKRQGLL